LGVIEFGSRTRRRSADRRTMPRLSMRKSEMVEPGPECIEDVSGGCRLRGWRQKS
jgi:hypothetical protein